MSIFHSRPWLFIVFAFIVLIAAWSSLILVAVRNRPQTIDVAPPSAQSAPEPGSIDR